MKENIFSSFNKSNVLYLLLFIVVIVNCFAQCAMFGSNFFSLYDEAYCLLKCRDAYDGIITGKTQWDLIVISWFPYFDLTNKISACWASVILIVATIFNVIISLYLVTHKCPFFKWSSIFLLMLFPVIGGQYAADIQTRVGWITGVNYLILQVFLLESAIAIFLVFYYHKHHIINKLALIVTGILSGIAVFVILPSGVLMIGCFILLIICKSKRVCQKFYDCLWFLLGVGIALCYIHIFIAPLPIIFKEMLFTASYVEKSGFGYTPIDFLIKIGKTFGEFLLFLPIVVGIYWLSFYSSFKNKWLEYIIYIGYTWFFIFCYYKYRGTGFVPTIPLIACSVCLLVGKIFYENGLLHRQHILYVFFLLFPLICAIGTNTNLWGRMGCFIVPWGILLILSKEQIHVSCDKKIFLGIILLLLIPLSINSARLIYHYKKYNTEHFVTGNKNMASISITLAQKQYFEKIQSIVTQYKYQPRKSIFFASFHDYCAVYALDAELSSRFHLPCNFPFFPKEQMLQPDFIILVPEESPIYKLEELPWGWPDQYDMYEIGTPETIHQKLIGDDAKYRLLYCRKSLKTND